MNCICGHPQVAHTSGIDECLRHCPCRKFRPQEDVVNHPAHYGGESNPYEHIKVVEAWGLGYALGSATKYIMRAGKKSPDAIEDLKKARFWVDREIQRLEGKLPIVGIVSIKYADGTQGYPDTYGIMKREKE